MYIKFGECKSRHVQYNLLNGVNDEKHRYSINVFIVCVDCWVNKVSVERNHSEMHTLYGREDKIKLHTLDEIDKLKKNI